MSFAAYLVNNEAEVVNAPSLEMFKIKLDGALSNLI